MVALAEAGISRSTTLRIVASAWDWLEKCPPFFVDESLLPLTLIRLASKFEAVDEQVEAALKLLQPPEVKSPRYCLSSVACSRRCGAHGVLPMEW